MANLIQFSDLQATHFSASNASGSAAFDLVPIIRPESTGSGYINLKARFDQFVPKSSSYSTNSLSASYAATASYARNASVTSVDTASYAFYAVSSSWAATASLAFNALLSNTASYVATTRFAETASYALNASGDGGITQSIYQSLPIGGIMMFASASIPVGWLECNGMAITQSAPYDTLFATINNEDISSSFGYKCLNDVGATRNGSGTYFKLPDLRGEFVRGWDNSRGVDTGRIFGSTQSYSQTIPLHSHSLTPHTHSISLPYTTAGGAGVPAIHASSVTSVGSLNFTSSVSQPTASAATEITGETRPRNVALVYCIRYANLEDYSLITTDSYIAGDVVGSLNNTTVRRIQNITVASNTPAVNDTLVYNGSQWVPGPVAVSTGIQMITPVVVYTSPANPPMTAGATTPFAVGSAINYLDISAYIPSSARLAYIRVMGNVIGPTSVLTPTIVCRASSTSPYYILTTARAAAGADDVHIFSTTFVPYENQRLQWQLAVINLQGQFTIDIIGYSY